MTRPFILLATLTISLSVPLIALQEGQPVLLYAAKPLDGGSFDSARLWGKVVIPNIWASWCPNCRQEIPALDAYHGAYHGQPLKSNSPSSQAAALGPGRAGRSPPPTSFVTLIEVAAI